MKTKGIGVAIKYIKSDYFRYYGTNTCVSSILLNVFIVKNQCFTYLFWFRLASFTNNILARIMHRNLSRKWGIHIPRNVKIGYGFHIAHGTSIVINGSAVIGNNCNISQCLTIGSNGHTPAVIGDNVYIGPGVCIVESVNIGSNSTIGAGSVVVKDVVSGTTVAGNPAKLISCKNHSIFIQNRFPL